MRSLNYIKQLVEDDQHLQFWQAFAAQRKARDHRFQRFAGGFVQHNKVVGLPTNAEQSGIAQLRHRGMPGEPLQRALFVQNVLFLPSTHRRRILKRGPLDQHGQIVVERIVSAQHLARAPAWIDVIDAVTVIEQAVGTTPRSGAYRHQLSPHTTALLLGFCSNPGQIITINCTRGRLGMPAYPRNALFLDLSPLAFFTGEREPY